MGLILTIHKPMLIQSQIDYQHLSKIIYITIQMTMILIYHKLSYQLMTPVNKAISILNKNMTTEQIILIQNQLITIKTFVKPIIFMKRLMQN